jgi:hypothetical protein
VFFAIYIYGVVTIGIAPLPIAALISAVLLIPLVVILLTSAMHFICQRVFRQKKYFYDKMLYITVAILLPIQFIFAPVTLFLPEKFSLALIYVLLLYQIVLLALALKAIANLEYWQALVTVFISVVVGILAFLCSIPFIMSTVGEGRSAVN